MGEAMPILKILRVQCDRCGYCTRGDRTTAMLLKRRLSGKGWEFDGRKAYCPPCAFYDNYLNKQRKEKP